MCYTGEVEYRMISKFVKRGTKNLQKMDMLQYDSTSHCVIWEDFEWYYQSNKKMWWRLC